MNNKIIIPSGVQCYFWKTSIFEQKIFYVEFNPVHSKEFEEWCFFNDLNNHPLITKGPGFVFTKEENSKLFDYED